MAEQGFTHPRRTHRRPLRPVHPGVPSPSCSCPPQKPPEIDPTSGLRLFSSVPPQRPCAPPRGPHGSGPGPAHAAPEEGRALAEASLPSTGLPGRAGPGRAAAHNTVSASLPARTRPLYRQRPSYGSLAESQGSARTKVSINVF